MERPDPFMIDVDEGQIIQLLQQEVTGIVQDVGARMIADRGEKPFECHPVMQVFTGVEFKT